MDGITIRRATPADAPVVARLLWDFNHEFDAASPDQSTLTRRFARLLRRDDVIVLLAAVAADDPTSPPVGFAYLTLRPTPYHDGALAQLEELYIRPPCRDQGMGTALLARSLGESVRLGGAEMHIGVDECDIATRRFYERHGFVNVEPGAEHRMLLYLRLLDG